MGIALELLNCSYYEHLKYAQELQLYLPLEHPKRREIEKALNELMQEIKTLTDNSHVQRISKILFPTRS